MPSEKNSKQDPGDIGLRVVEAVRKGLMVDDAWCEPRARGFDWWPHELRQTVDASPVWVDAIDGTILSRITIRTDLYKLLPSIKDVLGLVGGTLNANAAFFAFLADDEDRSVKLVTTMHVYDSIEHWAPQFLVTYSAAQAEMAYKLSLGGGVETMFGLAQSAHPRSGMRAGVDEMADIVDQVIVPMGEGQSRFANHPEFEDVLDLLNKGNCFANGDGNGLSAEFPFGDDTSLLRLIVKEPHPKYGFGLILGLALKLQLTAAEAGSGANALNALEASGASQCNLVGAWHARELGDSYTVAFSSFVPNALYGPMVITNSLFVMVRRAHWAHAVLYPGKPAPLVEDVLRRRLSSLTANSKLAKRRTSRKKSPSRTKQQVLAASQAEIRELLAVHADPDGPLPAEIKSFARLTKALEAATDFFDYDEPNVQGYRVDTRINAESLRYEIEADPEAYGYEGDADFDDIEIPRAIQVRAARSLLGNVLGSLDFDADYDPLYRLISLGRTGEGPYLVCSVNGYAFTEVSVEWIGIFNDIEVLERYLVGPMIVVSQAQLDSMSDNDLLEYVE
jgi:hypothetical protein